MLKGLNFRRVDVLCNKDSYELKKKSLLQNYKKEDSVFLKKGR